MVAATATLRASAAVRITPRRSQALRFSLRHGGLLVVLLCWQYLRSRFFTLLAVSSGLVLLPPAQSLAADQVRIYEPLLDSFALPVRESSVAALATSAAHVDELPVADKKTGRPAHPPGGMVVRSLQTTGRRQKHDAGRDDSVRNSEQHFPDASFQTSETLGEYVPSVGKKYAEAARLVNEYVARDSLYFDDVNRPCPETSWMRVNGTTGRCFKSFDFTDFGSGRSSRTGESNGPSVKQTGTWEQAERLCMSFGAHLAGLHTAAEAKFAHMVLDRRPDACWLGLRRVEPRAGGREDGSNGWQWITSDRGIVEDSEYLEWSRDWIPVWDSISYPRPLCGVFTRKGVAARRCYANPNSHSGDSRRSKDIKAPEKLAAPQLSCFLCATTLESKLPRGSFASAAERGEHVWADDEQGTAVSATTRGAEGWKGDRKQSKEGSKGGWLPAKQRDRVSSKGLRRQGEQPPGGLPRPKDERREYETVRTEGLADWVFSDRQRETERGEASLPATETHFERGLTNPGSPHTQQPSSRVFDKRGPIVSDIASGSPRIAATALDVSNTDSDVLYEYANQGENALKVTAEQFDERNTEDQHSLAVSSSHIKDSESYDAFLQNFMRIHTKAKEKQARKRETQTREEEGSLDVVPLFGLDNGAPTEGADAYLERTPEGESEINDGAGSVTEQAQEEPNQPMASAAADYGAGTATWEGTTPAKPVSILLEPGPKPEELDLLSSSRPTAQFDNSGGEPYSTTSSNKASSELKVLLWCLGVCVAVLAVTVLLVYSYCWRRSKQKCPDECALESRETGLRVAPQSPSLSEQQTPMGWEVKPETDRMVPPEEALSFATTGGSDYQSTANEEAPSAQQDLSFVSSCSTDQQSESVALSLCSEDDSGLGGIEVSAAVSVSQSALFEQQICGSLVSCVARDIHEVAPQVSDGYGSARESAASQFARGARHEAGIPPVGPRLTPVERLQRLRARVDAM